MNLSPEKLVPVKFRRDIQSLMIQSKIHHIFGPKHINLDKDEAAITCIFKNGEFYIDAFIEHYLNMGFRHIFFIDNGSTDNSIDLLRKHSNVSVFKCTLPIEKYQGLLKKYAAERFISKGWCLDVDMDEFFDYPFSHNLPLKEFINYLNNKRYTGVLCQMVDLFSELPVASLCQKMEKEDLKSTYRYYEISNVNKVDYFDSDFVLKYSYRNEISSSESRLFFGGIRKSLYGRDCLLSKHSLFLAGSGLDLFRHVHFINNARLADISCALLHYKFTSNAFSEAMRNFDAFPGVSKGYADFLNLMKNKHDRYIKSDNSFELRSVDDLVNNNYLFCSSEYHNHINQCCSSI